MMPSFSRDKSPISRAVIPTRILVVDDEPLIRWSLCSALAAHGFDAVSAADAADARLLAGEWPPPRVVLLDRRSCDTQTLELIADIRSVYPGCRFVIMTTARDYAVRPVFGQDVELIQKPFDLGDVVRLVTRLVTDAMPIVAADSHE